MVGIVILVFLLARIVWLVRVVLWYGVSMLVVLFARVEEVVGGEFGIKTLDEVPNNVIAALLSSLMASFPFAEQTRVEASAN